MKKSNEHTKTKNKMKKTIKFLSMAALAMVGAMTAGCSSDDNIISQPQQPENKNNVVTLTTTVGFDEATGGITRALAIDYDAKTFTKTFAAGDQIAVVYENTSNTMVKAESVALTEGNITAEGKSATFTVTLTDPKASGTVKYIYPAAMAGETDVDYTNLNSQDGTLETIASNLDLAVYEGNLTSDVKLPASASLENKLAIIAYTIKDSDGSSDLTSTITGMTLSDGTNNYEVTRSAAAGPIYVAIQPTSEADIEYTATNGTKNYIKSVTSKTYAAGQFYQLGLMTEKPDLLSGVFSVSSTKTVKFSKGNLRYASGAWSFFDNQYDYYTSYSESAWDKFGWSTSKTTYGMNTSTSADTYSGNFVDWGATMGTGWRTLTSAEWTYLFNTRSASTVGGTANGRYAKATVNGKTGMILFPDTYTHPDGVTAPTSVNTGNAAFTANSYSSTDWEKMESAGCVFLPAAGLRSGTSVSNSSTHGYYWSSTTSNNSPSRMGFRAEDVTPDYNSYRYNGFSVRLVKEQ